MAKEISVEDPSHKVKGPCPVVYSKPKSGHKCRSDSNHVARAIERKAESSEAMKQERIKGSAL